MNSFIIDLSKSTHEALITNDGGNFGQFDYGKYAIQGKEQNMLVLNAAHQKIPNARLTTDYFEMRDKKHGFFVMDYFLDGDGIREISIAKQDQDTKTIWKSTKKSDKWQKVRLVVDTPSKPRFFITVLCGAECEGRVAIAKIDLKYCECCDGCGENEA